MHPKNIGRYKVERLIGRGGMSVIYLARDPNIKRLVAIKVLPRQMSHDPNFRTRFQREAEVVASLEHPAIVPIYDFGEDDDRPYFVMRYMAGGSLGRILKRGTMSIPEVAEIVARIAPALDEAHRQGVIHRDLKPGNILFDQWDQAYLADFGIVKFLTPDTNITGNAILGTPAYMSPEIARGDANIDGRSDVYALGVLIYKVLCGELPYDADTPMGMAMKHITDPVPNILDVAPTLPPATRTLIETAMAKKPADRYANAVALADALLHLGKTDTTPQTESPKFTAPSRPNAHVSWETLRQDPNSEEDVPPALNLPPQSTNFIGREETLAQISELLRNTDCRLLTLLGPGGIGKTRLAIQAAQAHIDNYPHGIHFVSLASVSAPEYIVSNIANALNFAFYSQEDPKIQLLNYLRGKKMMLVMDNYEHLIAGADLVQEILQTAADVRILATSRERLNLQEEWILQIGGMNYPNQHTHEDVEFPAVQLFLDRAQKVQPSFEASPENIHAISHICKLVQGIPLGIELAAAWVRMLTPQEIASEIADNMDFLTTSLRNVSQRHRSLRAVFDYSWKLITEKERKVFRNLAVFRGSFTRKAATQVIQASIMDLSALVDKSLLRKNPSNEYEMLVVLRQYAEEKQDEYPDEKQSSREKHCDYYLSFLASREEHLKGGEQTTALTEIASEIENIRAAWRWAIKNGKEGQIAHSVDSMYRFHEIRGWLREGEEIIAAVETSMRSTHGDTTSLSLDRLIHHGKIMSFLGAFNYRLGAHDKARSLLQKSVSILRNMDARAELAFSLNYLGAVDFLQENYDAARELLNESLSLFRETDNRLGQAISLHHLGLVAFSLDDFYEARRYYEQSLELNRDIGDQFGIAISLNNLGMVARELGEYVAARALHQESLAIREEINDRWGKANSLEGLGLVAFRMQEFAMARDFLKQCLAMYQEIGDARRIKRTEINLQIVQETVNA